MDDLTRVREMEADVPPLTVEARSAARVRLQRAILQNASPGRSAVLSRRLVFRLVAGGVVAASVVGSTVVATKEGGARSAVDTTEHGGARVTLPMTMLSAARVLHKAADRSRFNSADLPIPRNDQYLYTKTYITQTPLKGGKIKAWTDESWMSVDGSKPSKRQEHGKIHNDPPLGKHEVQSIPTEYAKLKEWPTDPDELLKRLGRGRIKILTPSNRKAGSSAGAAADPDAMVYTQACLLMQGPRVMPPGLQAATFEAVAKLPRIKVNDDEVNALGRHGIGVSYPNMLFSIIFDRKTYDYLGMRLKGSHAKLIDGRWRQVGWYSEMRGREKVGVVDRIGQRP
ncbi:CU044_5270 family protein [Streptomyces sp. NPDC051320]|uniref:CU044_5270 family protein n=1 Tax=Streptomyces sp. NPDC051320 TaxID=3154644 RepID=UPI00341F0362